MDGREMNTIAEVAIGAASPLIVRGYEVIDRRVYEQHFGSGWVLFARDDVRLRIVNDRGQWFVEIGSSADPEEWFDARLVLAEVGSTEAISGTDDIVLKSLCELLAETAPMWEVLFLSSTFTTARKSLRSREVASARERSGADI
jgi:hypothetical protein